MPQDSNADLVGRLFREFESRHSLTVIVEIVAQSHDELAGQTPATAQPELLERLARHRLAALPDTTDDHSDAG